jgi:phytoene/squalene synthetase
MSRPDAAGAADLQRYTRVAQDGTARVIGRYSTSFGMATRLFDSASRGHIRNVYGLVRIADEIVDGAAGAAGLDLDAQRRILDELEADTERAIRGGYSANLVVHAFAATARATGIDASLTRPFFASMRRDLDETPFTADQVGTYIYGSAEVVGVMCLRVFLHGEDCTGARRARLERGARSLGAAFQKINFLRDFGADWRGLHRNYFPHVDPEAFTEAEKAAILDDIDDDLRHAREAIPDLPDGCRAAVLAAHDLFSALSAAVRATPAGDILTTRISVPAARKARILLRAQLSGAFRGRRR